MDDQSRLTYLTRYYYELQGIRTAPLWLCGLVFQVNIYFDSGYSKGYFRVLFLLTAIGLMGLFMWLAGRYYRHRFGWLNPTWISLPDSRVYWSLYWFVGIWAFYCIFISHFRGFFPYVFTIVWISPLFNAENPPVRRIYFGLAGAVVIFSALFLQIAHGDGRIIIAIQCVVLLALGVADHLLLMSLCTPPNENADA
ncbi:MAG: hypothetical protein WCA21_10520 [Terracidiphilus sp.]